MIDNLDKFGQNLICNNKTAREQLLGSNET